MQDLLSTTSRVETPFIIVKIGNYNLGMFTKDTYNLYNSTVAVYPNFMQSLNIVKTNGAINNYTLTMAYGIKAGDDPNFLEKIFSSVSKSRKIKLSYGDLSTLSYIYKEEEALIQSIRTQVDLSSSRIVYTLNCISTALKLNANNLNFGKQINKRPSELILDLIYNDQYGLLDIFYGMRNKSKVLAKGLITVNDKPVNIEAKQNITIFNYILYLVECMSDVSDSDTSLKKLNKYNLIIYDDTSNEFGGPYFKISKMTSNIQSISSIDAYTIDVGFPNPNNMITSISFNDNETYALYYDYSMKNTNNDYIYRIDNEGNYNYIYSPSVSNSKALMKTTEADKDWWSKMTQFPITTTITMKGLIKPSLLMNYVKLNIYFYGKKYIYSGYYIVTQQVDNISSSGYSTTLNLTRVGGEENGY